MAWTVDKRTGETVEGPIVSIQMAKEEGWYGKAGSKWKTMPEVMLRYRAASFFSRAYCPDLTGGFHSVEEARDAGKSEESEHGSPTALEAELRTLKETKQPAVVPAAPAVASTPAPIEPEMLPLDDVPSAPAPAPETKLPVITEVEKLREKLTGALRINYTDAEAEKWLYGHFNRPMKELRVLDLKEAIAAINSELDAKM